MARYGIVIAMGFLCTPLVTLGAAKQASNPSPYHPPPGVYRTSWVGNSFGGNGGPNGFGYWVQEGVSKLVVSPDGTAFCGVEYDEAGRCVGLYKEGHVNRVLLQERGPETAWGFGTANKALAVWRDTIYVGNLGKKLLRFHWQPGDINSAKFVGEVDMRAQAVGMAANKSYVVVAYPDGIEVRQADNLQVLRYLPLPNTKDVALAPNNTLWALTEDRVVHLDLQGKSLPQTLIGFENPTAIALSNQNPNILLVCDDGPRQQVLLYDLRPKPHLLRVFGRKGGLMSGVPGQVEPDKLFGLRGAGMDAKGDLFVAMSFGYGPNGHCVLRCFSPQGKLLWQVMGLSFVDTFGFDPHSDGTVVYSRDAVFHLDLKKQKPGSEWSLQAVTVPYPKDVSSDRVRYGASAIVRDLQGRRVLYLIGQYAGGFQLFTFSPKEGFIAHPCGHIGRDDSWAWYVDPQGDIWNGDGLNRTILCYRFEGWDAKGDPIYDWKHPQAWPWPNDFELIRRIIYVPSTDTLYLFGYLKGQTIDSWGVIGHTARRYDGWRTGNPTVAWTLPNLPVNPHGNDQGQPLTPQAVDLAGDYLFIGMVKPEDNIVYTHIFRAKDGAYVGSFEPGPAVGEGVGWQDMPYSLQAFQRRDGEYMVLVEEDWRGKNLLYRWWPNGTGLSANAK